MDFSTDGQNTCAISSDKNLYCWGQNNFNELQTNDQKPSAVPIKIDTQKNQDKIFVGYSRICIKSNADFYCWGNNAWGEFSNDFPYTDTKIHKIGSNELIQSISLGSDFFCYLLNDGKVYCSGKNQYGQLGKNDTSPQKNLITPVTIPPAIQIDSTNHHTCALTEDSELYCWGINEFMPGENPPNNSYTTPIKIKNISDIKKISISDTTSCALVTNEDLMCWGYGWKDFLIPSPTPLKITWELASQHFGELRLQLNKKLICAHQTNL